MCINTGYFLYYLNQFIIIKGTDLFVFFFQKYFWRGLGIIIVLIDIYYLHLLVPKLNFLSNGNFFMLNMENIK